MENWIKVKERPLTDEERDMLSECFGDSEGFMYDCLLPDDGQDVLITTNRGTIAATTYYADYGCYFEGYEDRGEVVAWMPLPEPYSAESSAHSDIIEKLYAYARSKGVYASEYVAFLDSALADMSGGN